MTYRLKKLSSLLILSLLLTFSKPVKASEAVVMFALPFLGAIVNQSWQQRNSYDHEAEMAEFYNNIKNLNHIPVGGCKIATRFEEGARYDRQACKQPDGSWKLQEGQYQVEDINNFQNYKDEEPFYIGNMDNFE